MELKLLQVNQELCTSGYLSLHNSMNNKSAEEIKYG